MVTTPGLPVSPGLPPQGTTASQEHRGHPATPSHHHHQPRRNREFTHRDAAPSCLRWKNATPFPWVPVGLSAGHVPYISCPPSGTSPTSKINCFPHSCPRNMDETKQRLLAGFLLASKHAVHQLSPLPQRNSPDCRVPVP